jgi:ATP-dependent Lon protease
MSDSRILPVLPLRDIVVFPQMVVPLFVGRDKSVRALEEVMRGDKQILLATQMNSADDEPAPDSIYKVGVIANVLQLLKLPDGTVKVLVEGKRRAGVVASPRRTTSSRPRSSAWTRTRASLRGRGAVARGHRAVRKLREAEQEGAVRGPGSIPQITEPGRWRTRSPRTCR